MAEKKKENVLKKYLDIFLFLFLGLFFLLLGFIGLLSKQDYRLYDFLLKFRNEPTQNEQILLVDIDNMSISEIGEWPWSRDIIADALLRMKEFGAKSVTFDVEYLSPSPLGVPRTSFSLINDSFNLVQNDIYSVLFELSDAIQQGYLPIDAINEQTGIMFNDYISPSINGLKDNLLNNFMYQDNDEYFGKALQFFNNSWMTVNNRDLNIIYTDEDIKYVEDKFLLENVIDPKNYIRKNNLHTVNEQYGGIAEGFSPTLHTLIKRANGCGFTNVQIDTDGSRRRIELLFNRNGKFLPQLVFGPLVNLMQVSKIQRNRNSVILYDCKIPGSNTVQNIKIPLDEHGRMMINWLQRDFDSSFRHVSFSDTYRMDQIENEHTIYLSNILSYELLDNNGLPLKYITDIQDLLKDYEDIVRNKQYLLSLCTGEENSGVSQEQYNEYFLQRASYFDKITQFTQNNILPSIEERLNEFKDNISLEDKNNFIATVKEQFDLLKLSIEEYNNIFTQLHKSFNNSFCIVGNTASSTTDMGATPFWRMYPNVGTHANIVNTIVSQDFIIPIYWVYYYVICFVICGIAILIFRKHSSKTQNISYGIIAIFLIIIPCVLLIYFSIYIPSITAIFFVIFNFIGGGVLRFVSAEKQKGFLRQAFSTYVSKEVVTQIVNDPSKLNLGGEEKNLSALFTDIKGFSSFSELVSPSQLISILNEYLGELSDIILQHQGTIDKYIGDSIVSFFGAPININDHAFKACCSAIRMKQSEVEFNKKHMIDGDIPRELFSRVGINTGKMLVGNMGTTGKLNYTVMGSEVNLASRLEGVNKVYDSSILVSESTWKEVDYGETKGILVAKPLDKVRVVGIETPVQLYNIIGFKNELSRELLEEVEIFETALNCYMSKDFKKAEKLFLQAYSLIPDDKTALIFAERCKNYIATGVSKDWDGVKTLTSK